MRHSTYSGSRCWVLGSGCRFWVLGAGSGSRFWFSVLVPGSGSREPRTRNLEPEPSTSEPRTSNRGFRIPVAGIGFVTKDVRELRLIHLPHQFLDLFRAHGH